MGQGGVACPKPAKGSSRRTRMTLRLKLGKQMRDAVWLRELERGGGEAFCQDCGAGPLLRTTNVLDPRAGHVAHDRGRRVAPEDRFNPERCRLLDRNCHLASHSMRFA